ncbi:MAG: hypothetical protein A2Y25_01035 [Candidatus Melainabacteria bacterium GWF2_37_15]|nr:MAG: hypothetical protein A2Y25_01035 [Candidatus Melainabacteria bacterium GWF2_37_15]
MIYQLINNIFLQSFSLVKYNLVLFLPFFIFLLVTGFVFMPVASISGSPSVFYMFLVMPSLLAVFLSGWLNMFKICVETSTDENLAGEKRTENSFILFREFFPGVGKYFLKIAIGILIYFFLFNIFMLVLERVLMSLLGDFESFSSKELVGSLSNSATAAAFWETISSEDKIKLFKIVGLESFFTLFFLYLTMFWTQLIVLKEIFPIKAFIQSFKTVIKDPINTFIIFISGSSLILLVIFVGAIVSVNPLLQLFALILFVLVIIYFLMLMFVYLEKFGIQEKINSNSGPNSNGQD